MSEEENDKKSKYFTVTVSSRISEILEALGEGGIVGKSRAEVAQNIISRYVEKILIDGTIEKLIGKKW